ncbi:MAG: AAA family ATPase, partial [Phyllobacterium sp.]
MTARDDIFELGKRVSQSIIGQNTMVERLIIGLLANGHLLVEGLP